VASPQPRNVLGTLVQLLLLLLVLAMLVGTVFVVFAVISAMNAPQQAVSGVGAQAGRALSGAQQALQNVTDPNHPPSGLTYDTEYSALLTWHVGERLPESSQYVLTLQAVRRREGAESPDVGQYAVIHAELRQPRETRIGGVVLRSDSEPHDYVVYKGETFRIGRAVYRVNWVSQEASALAAGVYRHPDAVSAPLKFEYD
jgi:hypothetical protein